MKRLLLSLLLVGVLITSAFAGSLPLVEEGNRVIFNSDGLRTTARFAISSIHLKSASGDEIGGASGFTVVGIDNVEIAECQSTSVSDQCDFVMPYPVVVNGMKTPLMDGKLFIYGQRR